MCTDKVHGSEQKVLLACYFAPYAIRGSSEFGSGCQHLWMKITNMNAVSTKKCDAGLFGDQSVIDKSGRYKVSQADGICTSVSALVPLFTIVP